MKSLTAFDKSVLLYGVGGGGVVIYVGFDCMNGWVDRFQFEWIK